MKYVKSSFRFYVNGSLHVALSSTALVCLTFIKLSFDYDYEYLLFNFFSTVVGYNFVKYIQVSNLYYRELTIFMKEIRIFTYLCFIGMLYFFMHLSIGLLWLLIPFLSVTVLYAVPIMSHASTLRGIAGAKIFIIAIVWTGVTVVVPAYYKLGFLNFEMFVESMQRFLFVLVLMFPFEIRDLAYDQKALKTIPQLIGTRGTKLVGSIILFLFTGLVFLKEDVFSIDMYTNLLIAIILMLFLWGSKRTQKKYYASFWVESVPIIWLLVYIIVNALVFEF